MDQEYDEDEMDRLYAIEEKYKAINAKINAKIGHDSPYDDLDDHNHTVSYMEHQIAHPFMHMAGSAGLGGLIGSLATAAIAPKVSPMVVGAAGVGLGGLLGLGSRISRDRAIKNIGEARKKRDAFKAEWDKLGAS